MPSYSRRHQLTNSLIYHIYNRSNGRLPIFRSEKDHYHWMGLIKEYMLAFKAKVYHWVLMSNHYHLLVEILIPEDLSPLMAGLNRAYTHYYHATYGTTGFLWQGRFKSQPVEKERYLIACGRYIERNPVRAGIVLKASEYPYSSARFYCCGQPDGITTENPVFSEFGYDYATRQETYSKFLGAFNPGEEQLFKNLEHPLGSREFIDRLLKIHGRYLPRRKGGIPKRFVAQHIESAKIS